MNKLLISMTIIILFLFTLDSLGYVDYFEFIEPGQAVFSNIFGE